MTTVGRYLEAPIRADLAEKMVFVGGPRQVGKTSLALKLIAADATRSHPAYLNWDDVRVRSRVLKGELPAAQSLVVLDEIHKYRAWRNLVKGFWDSREKGQTLLVTGSARLDHYRRGGDSLHGRYHHYRLHPFTWPEVGASAADVDTLLRLGGFPEPYVAGSERTWRRWRRERLERVVKEDLRDLEHIRDVGLVELLVDALPERVGSPLSVKSLREDLQVAHDTAERWVTILENLYVCYRIPPHGSPRIRAVKKEQKLYLWDWSEIAEPGPRFENLVASHLLKYCYWLADTEGHKMELRFLRDTDGREVDFVVVKDRKPIFAVEAKVGDETLSPALRYFRARTPIPAWYQVHLGKKDVVVDGVRILPFTRLCTELGLV